jgi:uncharacterized Zn-finger protein
MPKKGRKTKEDVKGDAFERLYAFLMSTNQNLPPLENSHLVVVEKNKISETQEEIEENKAKEAVKEKAEFDKLFAQLSSLSSKSSVENSVPRVSYPPHNTLLDIPHVPVNIHIEEPLEEPLKEPLEEPLKEPLENSSNEFDEIYEQIIRIIAMKTKMIQADTPIANPIVKPVVKPIVKPVVKPIVKPVVKPIVKPVVKTIPECGACKKTFATKGSLTRHQQTTVSCQKWLALPEEQKLPIIDKPIHMIVDDYLKQATTGDKPFQCRFCSITFTNRGNHHKHYQSATTCNRMAYIEYKRLVAQ